MHTTLLRRISVLFVEGYIEKTNGFEELEDAWFNWGGEEVLAINRFIVDGVLMVGIDTKYWSPSLCPLPKKKKEKKGEKKDGTSFCNNFHKEWYIMRLEIREETFHYDSGLYICLYLYYKFF